MNDKLKSALETISEHCKMQPSCDECCFIVKGADYCFFACSILPCDWDGDSGD